MTEDDREDDGEGLLEAGDSLRQRGHHGVVVAEGTAAARRRDAQDEEEQDDDDEHEGEDERRHEQAVHPRSFEGRLVRKARIYLRGNEEGAGAVGEERGLEGEEVE